MRFLSLRLSVLFGIALIVITACQGPPPTMFVLVVTATPGGEASTTPGAATTQSVLVATATTRGQRRTPTATPTVDLFPTPTINDIQVAEQRFEKGRMFWLQPINQIWVLFAADASGTYGRWAVYDDTYREGEPAFDPELVAPPGFFQPERGFGELWRTNPEVRELGWALEPEFGHVTRYEYHAGGSVNAQNQYIQEPGYHVVRSRWGERYQFNEGDNTWTQQR